MYESELGVPCRKVQDSQPLLAGWGILFFRSSQIQVSGVREKNCELLPSRRDAFGRYRIFAVRRLLDESEPGVLYRKVRDSQPLLAGWGILFFPSAETHEPIHFQQGE